MALRIYGKGIIWVMASAVLFHCSLAYTLLYLLAYVWFIPISYLLIHNETLSFVQVSLYGLVWGLTFFALHWYDLLCILRYSSNLGLMVGGTGFLVLLMWSAFWSAAWFVIMHGVYHVLQHAIRICILGVNFFACCMLVALEASFFYALERWLFVLIDTHLIYPLCNPLMPLVASPLFLQGLTRWGAYKALFIMFLAQTMWAMHPYSGIVVYTVLICMGYTQQDRLRLSIKTHNLQRIVWIKPLRASQTDPLLLGQQLCEKIEHASRLDHAKLFVMPESAFPFPLNQHPEVLKMWINHGLDEKQSLLIGSHLKNNKGTYNVAYIINTGRIRHTYFKKKLMPFFEYIPSQFNTKKLKKLFFPSSNHFCYPPNTKRVNDHEKYQIMICSEFFLGDLKHQNPQQPLIVLLNDNWFNYGTLRN